MTPPIVGAKSGASAVTNITRLITRAYWSRSNRSRTSAGTVTAIAAPPSAWSARAASKSAISSASAQPNAPTQNSARPPPMVARRPSTSDSGPRNNCDRAKTPR